jgi:pilus assembly protein CpaE
MYSRAVLESPQHTESRASGQHVGLRLAGLRHPDAVERLLGRIDRGDDLPLVGCCAEDLEAVRRHLGLASVGGRTTEIHTVPEPTQDQHQEPRRTPSRQRHSTPASAEPKRAFTKILGVLPMVVLILAVIWQLGLLGVTATLTSHAADEAARAAGDGGTTAEVRGDALRSVPSWFRTNMVVSQTALGTVKVTSSVPVLAPIFTLDGLDLTSEAPIVTGNF